MNNLTLSEVIARIQEGELYKAYYADVFWHIKKSAGNIWYCDKDGNIFENTHAVPLTFSNLEATYEFIK